MNNEADDVVGDVLLLISGPVGVGKTTTAHEVSEQLEALGVPHTMVDLDALAQTYPRPADDPFGQRLALENLGSVWRAGRRAGARNLIIARVIEDVTELDDYRRATGIERIELVTLMATPRVLEQRVRRRELGSGVAWHVERALELRELLEAAELPGAVIDADGSSVQEIARAVVESVEWSRS